MTGKKKDVVTLPDELETAACELASEIAGPLVSNIIIGIGLDNDAPVIFVYYTSDIMPLDIRHLEEYRGYKVLKKKIDPPQTMS